MDITSQGTRRNSRIAGRITERELINQVVGENNRIILNSPYLRWKDTNKIFCIQSDDRRYMHKINGLFYQKTKSGYLIFDRGVHFGNQEPQQEAAETHPQEI